MKQLILFIAFILLFSQCSRQPAQWTQLSEEGCAQYVFGRVEAKRLLTDEDKSALLKEGLRIQEYVMETQYLGNWDKRWERKSLDETPLRELVPIAPHEKLASGMTQSELERIGSTPGSAMVLLQTFAPVDSLEIRRFGKVVFSRDHFYRLVVPHPQLTALMNYSCLRFMSIVKADYEPDAKPARR